jgi:hypothetical protein
MNGYPGTRWIFRKAIAFQRVGKEPSSSKASVKCVVKCFPYVCKIGVGKTGQFIKKEERQSLLKGREEFFSGR